MSHANNEKRIIDHRRPFVAAVEAARVLEELASDLRAAEATRVKMALQQVMQEADMAAVRKKLEKAGKIKRLTGSTKGTKYGLANQ